MPRTIFHNKSFLSVVMGHFSVDLLNGGRSVLLTFLSGVLGLSNAALGFYAMLYQVSGALVQPFFGYLADHFGVRWVVFGGVFWIGSFFSLAMLVPEKWTLAFLILAGIGSGAFHPAGVTQATLSGRIFMSGQETLASSYFFLFGETGYFLGPILMGALIETGGLPAILILSVLTLPVALFISQALKPIQPESGLLGQIDDPMPPEKQISGRLHWFAVIALVLVAGFQAWVQQNMIIFLPKFLKDYSYPPSIYGLLVGFFVGGSAIGILVGGRLADRYGKARMILVGMLLGTVPLFLVPMIGFSFWLFLTAALAGFLTGSPYSSIIVLAQRLIPGGRGFASGLILGFIFSSGALGTWLSGAFADRWGTPFVFYFSAFLSCMAGLLAIVLIEKNKKPMFE
jgi:MFS transporter, FSR family, fosmidomycin resistance protein